MNEDERNENSSIKQEETSLLSMVDLNTIQNIFINLVEQYQYSTYGGDSEELKKSFTLLLNFSLSCKLFFEISKQPLFPLILNNININLNYKKYLKILYLKQQIEKGRFYKEKDINAIFYHSCALGYYDLVNTLINYGPNINHPQGSEEWRPLMITAISGNIKTVKKLIKFKNLNMNYQSFGGTTALINASSHGEEDIVKILLSRKDIDINIKDVFGKTALDWAKERKFENIIQLLESYQKLLKYKKN